MRRKSFVRSVAFVGMDGSGKSTQSGNLARTLQARGYPVRVIHPFGWKILSFLSTRSQAFLPGGHQGTGHANTSAPRFLQPVIAWAELSDIALYIWWAYLRCALMTLISGKQVWLISDRAFDDLLVKHRDRKTLPDGLLAALHSFVPRAEYTIWLHTLPETALTRDGEFPASYYTALHRNYSAFAEQFGWHIIPTSGRSCEAIFANVLETLALKLPEAYSSADAQTNAADTAAVDSIQIRLK